MQRGNNKSDIFRAKHDYELFLATLAEACDTHKMSVNGYVLMTNHVHLVLTPQTDDALPLTMQAIGRRYVYYFNKEYGRTGGLFEGRYRSLIINTELYWFRCMRYVELNPVRIDCCLITHSTCLSEIPQWRGRQHGRRSAAMRFPMIRSLNCGRWCTEGPRSGVDRSWGLTPDMSCRGV